MSIKLFSSPAGGGVQLNKSNNIVEYTSFQDKMWNYWSMDDIGNLPNSAPFINAKVGTRLYGAAGRSVNLVSGVITQACNINNGPIRTNEITTSQQSLPIEVYDRIELFSGWLDKIYNEFN